MEKVILITGASSGIGSSICEYLKSKGMVVFCASRTMQNNEEKQTFTLEVTDQENAKKVISHIFNLKKRIDVLINVAGCGIAGSIEDTPVEEIKRQMDVNFIGTVVLTKEVLTYMRKQKSGLIINFSSIAGLFGLPYQAFYSASKFAVKSFSQALRLEVEQFGIKVVVIEPGDFKSNFTVNRRKYTTTNSEYARSFSNAIEKIEKDEKNGEDPVLISKLIYKIIHSKNPKTTYISGPFFERVFAALIKLLPEQTISFILKKYYRLPD